MTGRAAGYCLGYALPGRARAIYGRGFGFWGRGRGRGRGRWFAAPGLAGSSPAGRGWTGVPPPWLAVPLTRTPIATMTRQQEVDSLKGQVEYLEDILDGLRRRLEELEPKTTNAKSALRE